MCEWQLLEPLSAVPYTSIYIHTLQTCSYYNVTITVVQSIGLTRLNCIHLSSVSLLSNF